MQYNRIYIGPSLHVLLPFPPFPFEVGPSRYTELWGICGALYMVGTGALPSEIEFDAF